MNKQRTILPIIIVSLFFSFNMSARATEVENASATEAENEYKDKIGTKALSGLANIGTGLLEIPKNAINVSNDSNVIWGVTAGIAKGGLFALGRILSGIADLVTFPFATTPITYPVYVWDDFDMETRFGDGMRLEDRPRRDSFIP